MSDSEEAKFQCDVMKRLSTLGYVGLPVGKSSTIDEVIVSLDDCWTILALFDFKFELSKLEDGRRQRRSVAQGSQVSCLKSPWGEKFYFIVAARDDIYIILDKVGFFSISNELEDGRYTINFPQNWEEKVQNQIHDKNIIIANTFDDLISEILKLLC
ncbi:MAG: hypothetical protein ACFFG0_06385 [Candidatus Thorarchaeota archaeon]